MANKRDLKKAICYACGQMAGQCVLAESTINGADIEKWDKIIVDIALLQEKGLNRVSVNFDKTLSAFENRKEYKKARRAYFKQVEKALSEFMHTEAGKIVERMNALLPKVEK